MAKIGRCLLSLLVTALLAVRAGAQPPAKDRLENSVERGLAFLALMQEKDGAWQAYGGNHLAVTALSLMAFLSAGHVPGEGPYQAQVEKGLRWLLQQQQPNGLFTDQGGHEMYHHGICTLLLAEIAAMTDAKTSRSIQPKLAKAVRLILQGQRRNANTNTGGWRYTLVGTDADVSVSGWQIMALRAARDLGCDVPAERIELALHFLQQCRDANAGGFGYTPGSPASVACTGTCILALELCGKDKHHSREALQAGSYLIKTPLKYEEGHFFYAAYYTSQAMFQLGNNYWNIHRPRMHKELFDHQQRNGGWLNNDGIGASYNTAMAILALTVEYRFLPIYQRNEGATARTSK